MNDVIWVWPFKRLSLQRGTPGRARLRTITMTTENSSGARAGRCNRPAGSKRGRCYPPDTPVLLPDSHEATTLREFGGRDRRADSAVSWSPLKNPLAHLLANSYFFFPRTAQFSQQLRVRSWELALRNGQLLHPRPETPYPQRRSLRERWEEYS